jgi:hypothetical protein
MQSKGTREEWRERVRAWQASGLSCAQFAQRAKVHPGTLMWWRWKLTSGDGDRPRSRAKSAHAASALTFVELAPQAAPFAAASESRIELEVGRVRLRVPDQFRPETLARVLEVLEARS